MRSNASVAVSNYVPDDEGAAGEAQRPFHNVNGGTRWLTTRIAALGIVGVRIPLVGMIVMTAHCCIGKSGAAQRLGLLLVLLWLCGECLVAIRS